MPKVVDEAKIRRGLELLNVPTPERPSVRNAAIRVGVAHQTLHDRFTGKHDPRGGKRTTSLLTLQQEKALIRFITFYDDWASPPTYSQILERVLQLARENNPSVTSVGKCWLRRFLKRHPTIRGRQSQQLDRDRAKADNIGVLRDVFQKYRNIIERFGIRPQDIYNFDEKGVMYGQTGREWVFTRRSRRIPYVQQDGSRKSITIIECARGGVPDMGVLTEAEDKSAASIRLRPDSPPHILPPVFISSGASYNESNFKYLIKTENGQPNILPNARFRKSENGYNDKAICYWYIREHFDPLTASFDSNGNYDTDY